MTTRPNSENSRQASQRVVAIALLSVLAACNYTMNKPGQDGGGPVAGTSFDPTNKANLNYANVQQNAITTSCFPCHAAPRNDAGINIETYANAFTHRAAISAAVQSGRMPKSGAMLSGPKALLLAWIAADAPEFAPAGTAPLPTPAPTPPPTPTPAGDVMDPSNPANLNFQNVLANVIQPMCFGCHATPRNAAGINLETYESAFAHRASVASAIQNGSMPMGRTMSAAQQALLIAWISAGAPRGTGGTPTQPAPTPVPTPPCEDDHRLERRGDNKCEHRHGDNHLTQNHQMMEVPK